MSNETTPLEAFRTTSSPERKTVAEKIEALANYKLNDWETQFISYMHSRIANSYIISYLQLQKVLDIAEKYLD